jgi:hypothetical protein
MSLITLDDFERNGSGHYIFKAGSSSSRGCPVCAQRASECPHTVEDMRLFLLIQQAPINSTGAAPPFNGRQLDSTGEPTPHGAAHLPGLGCDSAARKRQPMFRGLLAYFPDALAAVSEVSYLGNEKHNKGEPMHWARSKSADELDCVVRHAAESGTPDDPGRYILTEDGEHEYGTPVLHSVALAWRALANAQKEIEALRGRGVSRGSKP